MSKNLTKNSLATLLVLFTFFSIKPVYSQISGIKTIPGDYASIAAFVTDVNLVGVGPGGVTANVAAGHTENTSSPILLTATGTAANPIVIQKSGLGANPVITRIDAGLLNSTVLGAQADGIFIIEGTDYLTINAIDLGASVSSTITTGIEYGYYLRKASVTDGCKFVTITNSTITMNKGLAGVTTGIMSSNNAAASITTTATGITVTTTGGRNEALTFSNNTLLNCHVGIYIRGFAALAPYDLYDDNINVTGNTIQNLGGASTSTCYGLYMIYYRNITVTNNNVDNMLSGGVAGTNLMYGLMLSTSSDANNQNISNNNVKLTTTTGSKYCIYASATSLAGATNLNNNLVNFGSNGSTGSAYGIYRFGNSLVSNMNNNTLGVFTQTSGIFYGFYNTSGGTISNNTILGYTNGGTSTQYGIYCSSTTYAFTIFGNVISNIAYTGSGNIWSIGVVGAGISSSIYNNTVTAISGAGTNVIGIYISGNTGASYDRNKISDISNTNPTGSSYGISIVSGAARLTNNLISDLKTSSANSVNDLVRGISITSTSVNTDILVAYNSIYLNATSTGTDFSSSGLFYTMSPTASTANLTLRNNLIINESSASGTGVSCALRCSAVGAANFNSLSNNNLLFAGVPSLSKLIFFDGSSNAYQTLATYQAAVSPAQVSSITGESFTYGTAGSYFGSLTPASPDFLRPVAGITSQTESGATNIAGITTDYSSVIRAGNAGYSGTGTNPDIGAYEFSGTSPAPAVLLTSAVPALSYQCIATSRLINVSINSTSTVSSAILNYAFNGISQAPINMVNSAGTNWVGTIPAASPTNANVTWSISATNNLPLTTLYTGTAYQDDPLLGFTATALNTASPICAGESTSLYVVLNNPAPVATYTDPIVTSPTSYADLGNVTISQNGIPIINNSSPYNSLVGSLGVASGVAGSYSNYTAVNTFNLSAGGSYDFSLTSLYASGTFQNHMRIYLDLNRDGDFTDAGECLYAPLSNSAGPHTETGTFILPANAQNGLTRMRVFSYEGAPSQNYINSFAWGEFEDYAINITSFSTISWSNGTSTVGSVSPLSVVPLSTTNYTATIISQTCPIVSTPSTITVNALPSAPIATNSSQCGTIVPTASVASSAGVNGAGLYFWNSAASNGTVLQTPPLSGWNTFYSDNFTGPLVAPGASLSGIANLNTVPGWLQLLSNNISQFGGITVAPGINAQAYKVEFDALVSAGGGADGFSWSFAPDVSLGTAYQEFEKGTGSKIKISFDAYGAMPNGQGIYLLYNNTAGSFNSASPGVLAYSSDNTWLGDTSNIVITINQLGLLSLTLNGTAIFSNIALPNSYLTENKSSWKHMIAGRTGGITMSTSIDNLSIQYATYNAGSTTYNTPVTTTSTFYVSEIGTNGCASLSTPVTVTVSSPEAVTLSSGLNPTVCVGQAFNTLATSNAGYAYTYDIASYAGSGLASPSAGASLTTTPSAAGIYPFVLTGIAGSCTSVSTINLTVNALPTITSSVATPNPVCSGDQVTLTASSIVSGAQTLPAGYCPIVSQSGSTGTLIDNVSFGTISNNTAASNAVPYSTSYNFTTNVTPGQTLPLSITISAPGAYVSAIASVWIDWNRNGILEAAEWQQIGTAIPAGTTATINVVVPINAQMGLTKMRIRTRGVNNPNGANDACVSMGSGENEEYLINIQGAPVNPYSYTWNSVPPINSAVGTLVSVNNTLSPVTQNWIVTVTDQITGCVNTLATLPVTIQPLITSPVMTNSTHCGIQIPSASALDPNGLPSATYNWYASAAGGTPLQSGPSNTFTSTIGATTVLYVSVTDISTGCQSATSPVTVTVVAPPVLSLSAASLTSCNGIASPLLTLSAQGYDGFVWSPAGGVNGSAATGYTFTANATTTYNLVATQSTGNLCSNTASVNLTVNPNPLITSATATNNAVCSGSTVNLTAASVPIPPFSATTPAATGANTTTTYPTPFGNYWWGAKQQFLFTAAELTTWGVLPGQITSVAFNVTTPSLTTLTNYTISMKNTVVNALTTNFETGLQTVYFNAAYTPANAVGFVNNTIQFASPFIWNGTSNVVLEICFNNGTFTNNAVASWSPAPLNSVHEYHADAAGICATISGGTFPLNRTLMQFGSAGLIETGILTWNWTGINQSGATATTTVTNPGPNNLTNAYIVQATYPLTGCSTIDTTNTITVFPLPVVIGGLDTTICSNNPSELLSLTASGANTYTWNNNVINGVPFPVSASGTYIVNGVDANGCIDIDSVSVIFSPFTAANAGPDYTICEGQNIALSALGSGTANVSWDNGIINGFAFTPSVGSTTYTLSITSGTGCTDTDQTILTVNPLPTVNIGANQTGCIGTPIVFTANATSSPSGSWTTNGQGTIAPNVTNNSVTYTPSTNDAGLVLISFAAFNSCGITTDTASIIVNGLPTVGAGMDMTICSGESILLSGTGTATSYTWDNGAVDNITFVPTISGLYTVVGADSNGCTDSDDVMVNINQTPNATNTAIDPVTLVATPSGQIYQWIDCATGLAVADATSDTLIALINGNYAVVVSSSNGCSDTSNCITVDQVGLYGPNSSVISIYPNPTNGNVSISLPSNDQGNLSIYDAQGKLVQTSNSLKNGDVINLNTYTPGMYTLKIVCGDMNYVERIIKQ